MRKFLVFSALIYTSTIFAQQSIKQKTEAIFEKITNPIIDIVFYDIKMLGVSVPIVVLVLILGAGFFTIYFKGVNFKNFGTAILTVLGKYDDLDKSKGDLKDSKKNKVEGEVSHFQALTAALSATIGLGNISGVAIAIAVGGPGATFWMIIAGLLGMASKFVECTLGVKYREVDDNGNTYGGPMYYLSKGLKEKGFRRLGKILAVFFAIMCVGGSIGGGNMFQANQVATQIANVFNADSNRNISIFIGIILAVIVGSVIIGGVKRIGKVTEKIVPFMGLIYVVAALIILFSNYDILSDAFLLILKDAFNPIAVSGGVVGVILIGFQRSAFSNEAGVGSSPIAHSAVKTNYPASEGLVALLEPFIDTVIVCTMTALVIVVSNLKYNLFTYGNLDSHDNVILHYTGEHISGVNLTSLAFESTIPNFSIVLMVAIILFAVSTMISWSYYGLQSWKFLFGKGKKTDLTYKTLFLIMTVVGSSAGLNSVVGFSDAMIFAMVFPNMIGLIFLLPVVKNEFREYLGLINKKVKEKKTNYKK